MSAFYQDSQRDYFRCTDCFLVFVPPSQHVTFQQEKSIYDLHENDPADAGYRRFLSRVVEPLRSILNDQDRGLDFGCGEASAVVVMMREHGFDMEMYDPIYVDQPQKLQQTYDFITCTEVVEHFRHPADEFLKLFAMLRSGGVLAIMTKMVIDQQAFSRWHYKNDQTHISFFSKDTFAWLAEKYIASVEFFYTDVILLRKI